MRKIGIIGMGNVGATLAHALVMSEAVDELVLIDSNQEKAVAQALDLKDSISAMSRIAVKVHTNDYSQLNNADILVIAVSAVANISDHDRLSEWAFSKQIIDDIAPKIKASGFKRTILSITNPCDVVVTYLQKLLNYPTCRIIGSGTVLDTQRVKNLLAHKFQVSPQSINGYVIGEHGGSQVAAWSSFTIGGMPLGIGSDAFSYEEAEALLEEAKENAWVVFHNKGYTNFGIAASALRIVQALYSDIPTVLQVSSFDPDAGVYYGYPSYISSRGASRASLSLTDHEQTKLEQSIKIIQSYL